MANRIGALKRPRCAIANDRFAGVPRRDGSGARGQAGGAQGFVRLCDSMRPEVED